MNNAFYGGQIREKFRGDLAVIITKPKNPKEEVLQGYSVFLYPIVSEEFIHLTGVMSITNPVERAYIGVSPQIGRDIVRKIVDKQNINSIDGFVVYPVFIGDTNSL